MPFGVYVHVPFCERRCDYCDFATWDDRSHLLDPYVGACVADLRRRADQDLPPVTTVFFGGGTPSLLRPEQVARLLDAVGPSDGAEVTLEANPDGVDAAALAGYRAAGVNRLSFGFQSAVPRVLATLGRTHGPAHLALAVERARAAGFSRVNVDLIYGTSGETADDWIRTLDHVVTLGVEHVSAYALAVEAATPLGRRVAAGEALGVVDADSQADRYFVADEVLAAAGLEWYEISNWARRGEECRHNLDCWAQGDYLGVGCAAHSHRAGKRWWNVRTPERYIARISAGEDPEAGRELLDPATRSEEAFALALRTRRGADANDRAAATARDLAAAGLVTLDGTRVVLSAAGRLLASDVTARLLSAGAAATPGALPNVQPVGTRYD